MINFHHAGLLLTSVVFVTCADCNNVSFHVQKQKQMIELCRTEGQKLLFEGKYDRVVPAAMESLKFAIEVYGLSSIELVPSYLILGEASIGQCQ